LYIKAGIISSVAGISIKTMPKILKQVGCGFRETFNWVVQISLL